MIEVGQEDGGVLGLTRRCRSSIQARRSAGRLLQIVAQRHRAARVCWERSGLELASGALRMRRRSPLMICP